MNINYFIKDLLLSRDGLVVPGLGSILVQYLPAEIDRENNKILPPRRSYTLNASIKEDPDKILAQHIARENKISVKEAQEHIDRFVKALTGELKEKDKAKLEGIGTIVKDEKGNLEIQEKEREKNFGMDPLKAEPFELEKTEKPQHEEPVKRSTPTYPPKRKNRIRRILSVTTAIIVLLFIIGGIYTGFFTFYIEKFSVGQAEKKQVVKKTEKKSVKQPATDTTDQIVEALDESIVEMTDKKRALMYKEPDQNASYHLIAGSFKKRVNAEEFQEKLRKDGYSSVILEKNGLYRVSVRAFSNKEDALVSLYHMRDTARFKSVWLLTLQQRAQ